MNLNEQINAIVGNVKCGELKITSARILLPEGDTIEIPVDGKTPSEVISSSFFNEEKKP